jgi:hypothetical protein
LKDEKIMMTLHPDRYVAAVFLEGRNVLVCRELASDGFPRSGFHFPGGQVKDDAHLKEDLKAVIAKKYGANLRILSPMTPIQGYSVDGTLTILYPFVCEKLSAFQFPQKQFDYRYLLLSDIADLYLDHLDKVLAEKVALYYPLLMNTLLPYDRSAHDQQELGVYLDSLIYFKGRLPASEISDYSALARTQIDMAGLRAAYKWLLNRYDLDYNEYLDLLDFRRSHGRGSR